MFRWAIHDLVSPEQPADGIFKSLRSFASFWTKESRDRVIEESSITLQGSQAQFSLGRVIRDWAKKDMERE